MQSFILLCRSFVESGLSLEPLETSLARIKMEDSTDSVIHFNSDHLNLEHKLFIENLALQNKALLGGQTQIRFKRLSQDFSPIKKARTQKKIEGIKKILVVASGKGGVGKSTVSVNLALRLSQLGLKIGILDADLYGPSLGMMLSLKDLKLNVNDDGKLLPITKYGLSVMSFDFLQGGSQDRALTWRGPLASKALMQLFNDIAWPELDYLIVDLPPGTGDIHLTLTDQVVIDGAVIVSTPQDIALLDAMKAMHLFNKLQIPILGLVENMSYYTCPSCGHHEDIFHENIQDKIKIEVLEQIPLERRIRHSADFGHPIALSLENHLFKTAAQKIHSCLNQENMAYHTAKEFKNDTLSP